MKYIILLLTTLINSFSFASDLEPNDEKGIIHKDTAAHCYRLMSPGFTSSEMKYQLYNKEDKSVSLDFSSVYSMKFYYKSSAEVKISISFYSIDENNQGNWSAPITITAPKNIGGYYEASLVSDLSYNLKNVSKIKVSSNEGVYLDELEFYYRLPEKASKKPDMKSLKKKMKKEKQRFKDKKSKEANKIRALEYRDHP